MSRIQSLETGAAERLPVPTVVLCALSVAATISGVYTLAGLPALIIGLVAFFKRRADPRGSRRLTTIGWFVFAVPALALTLVVVTVGSFFLPKWL